MQRNKDDKPAAARRCPICGKLADSAELPFCSRRCAEIDLHRWLGGAYRVPGNPAAPEAPPGGAPDERKQK